MAHKYFDELGVADSDICMFNTTYREQEEIDGLLVDSERQKKWDLQREEYGFDDRETWALDFTAAAWLHSHLKMYLDIAAGVINLDFYKFNIPVLKEDEVLERPSGQIVLDAEVIVPMYDREVVEMTEGEAIQLCIEYLEDYLTHEDRMKDSEILEDDIKIKSIAEQKGAYAFMIFGIILPTVWW